MKLKHIIIGLVSMLGIGAAVGAVSLHDNLDMTNIAKAYDGDETTFYLTGEFNDWNKTDEKAHLSPTGKQGNNYQFDSDFVVNIPLGTKFNFVYTYNDGANWNTFCPDLLTNSTDFNHPDNTDYLVATKDIAVKFYFQVYISSGAITWSGTYWYEYTDSSVYENDHKAILESWSYDFIKATSGICSDNGTENNLSDLEPIWSLASISEASSYYVAGDFNGWTNPDSNYNMKKTGSNTYAISNVFLSSSQGFKITDGTWDNAWPSSNEYPGSNGYYTIYFNSSTSEVTYEKQFIVGTAFEKLSSTAKSLFTSGNTNYYTADAYARYSHIVNRYSSLANFANATVTRSSNISLKIINLNNGAAPIIVAVIAVISLTAIGGYYFLSKNKKKKEN